MLWATSPACTELETHVLDWLVEMLDLPPAFHSSRAGGGVLQDTASSAALCALIAARERATGERSNREGIPPGLVAYASREAHSSVEKACGIAGIGRDGLRLVDTDATHALDPVALQGAIARDRAAGRQPFFVAATVGTTSSTAMDPVPAMGTIARREDLWLHVDAAHAGAAAVCPEFRPLQAGLEHADSYCFNPHKWLLTNFDCDCFWVADRGALVRSLSVLPEYLRNRATESGAVLDYRDWQVPLGRRFRALKLWFVIRHYGVEGSGRGRRSPGPPPAERRSDLEPDQPPGHRGRRPPQDLSLELVEPHPAPAPQLVPPPCLVGELGQRGHEHPVHLPPGGVKERLAGQPPDHGHHQQRELDGVDGRQIAEHLDRAGLDPHLLVGLPESGGDGSGVLGMGAAPGERQVPGVRGHGQRALGENQPDLATPVLVERGEHRRPG
jgi:hypothetical protein